MVEHSHKVHQVVRGDDSGPPRIRPRRERLPGQVLRGNEFKIALVFTLLNYDWKLPKINEFVVALSTDATVEVLVRKHITEKLDIALWGSIQWSLILRSSFGKQSACWAPTWENTTVSSRDLSTG